MTLLVFVWITWLTLVEKVAPLLEVNFKNVRDDYVCLLTG